MIYQEFSQRDWTAFSNLNDTVVHIDQKCESILVSLRDAFLKESLLGRGACQIQLTSNSTSLATFVTPVGEGRIIRGFSRSGAELQGVLVLQRKSLDELDRDAWTPVWRLTVPRYDAPFIGTGDNRQLFELSSYTSNRGIGAFTMAMTLLDAMVDHS